MWVKYECEHWHASHTPPMSKGPLALGKEGLGQMTGQKVLASTGSNVLAPHIQRLNVTNKERRGA